MRIAYSMKGSILIVGSFYYRFALDADMSHVVEGIL